jgi:hypothetical protein
MTLTVKKERFLELMNFFPEARDYYKPRAEARRIEFKRLMRNFYKKLEQNCIVNLITRNCDRGKIDCSSSDEEGLSVDEILIRASNPNLKKLEKSQKRQSH